MKIIIGVDLAPTRTNEDLFITNSLDELVDFGCQKHYRVQHGNNEFANGHSHINGIENFWGWAKIRLAKFRRSEEYPKRPSICI